MLIIHVPVKMAIMILESQFVQNVPNTVENVLISYHSAHSVM